MSAWHKTRTPAAVSSETLVTLEALAADGFIIFRNADGSIDFWRRNQCPNERPSDELYVERHQSQASPRRA